MEAITKSILLKSSVVVKPMEKQLELFEDERIKAKKIKLLNL